KVVRGSGRELEAGEAALRRRAELDQHLGGRDRKILARADQERDARPAPALHAQMRGCERLDVRGAGDALLVAVAAELAAHQILADERRDCAEQLRLLVAQSLRIRSAR